MKKGYSKIAVDSKFTFTSYTLALLHSLLTVS